MPDPAGTYYDNTPAAPWACGPVVQSWLPEERCYFYRQRWRARIGNYTPPEPALTATASNASPPSAYFIGDSEPRGVGGDRIEFERTWVQLPPDRVTYEPYAATIPEVVEGALGSFSLPSKVKLTRTYAASEHEPTPNVELFEPTIISTGGNFRLLGTFPEILPAWVDGPQTVSRWKGRIYETITRKIYWPSAEDYSP